MVSAAWHRPGGWRAAGARAWGSQPVSSSRAAACRQSDGGAQRGSAVAPRRGGLAADLTGDETAAAALDSGVRAGSACAGADHYGAGREIGPAGRAALLDTARGSNGGGHGVLLLAGLALLTPRGGRLLASARRQCAAPRMRAWQAELIVGNSVPPVTADELARGGRVGPDDLVTHPVQARDTLTTRTPVFVLANRCAERRPLVEDARTHTPRPG